MGLGGRCDQGRRAAAPRLRVRGISCSGPGPPRLSALGKEGGAEASSGQDPARHAGRVCGLRVLRGSTSPGPEASLANRRPHPRLLGSHDGSDRQGSQTCGQPIRCSVRGMALRNALAGRWGRGTGEGLGPRKPESGCPEGHSPTPEATWGAGFLPRLQTLASGASMRPGREEWEGPSWLVGSGDVLRPPFPHSPVPPLPLASVGNSDHRGPDAGVELARRESG